MYQGFADSGQKEAVGRFPGIMLATLACLPVAGILLVAQVLPQMGAAFHGVPHLDLMISMALTIPALTIAVFSWCTGWLADRVGKRRLLLGALAAYAVLGVAPMLLNDLGTIIIVRAGTGIAEGIIMTCSTALIGDLYPTGRREGLLSLQTACASAAAVIFAVLGGVLGDMGWRMPFAVYAISILFIPAVLFLIPRGQDKTAASAQKSVMNGTGPSLPVGSLLGVCGLTLVLSTCFYVAQIQLPYLLNAIGTVAPSTVGLVSALANAAVVAGTLCFAFLLRRHPLMVGGFLSFLLLALGLAVVSQSSQYVPLCIGLVIASFAGGLALPTFLNGAMALLNPEQRGLGTGMWQSSFWCGQFFSPILVIAATGMTGSLSRAVMVFAAVSLVTLLTLPLLLRARNAV
jgi:MFS family permease